jgi:hypothetical protein
MVSGKLISVMAGISGLVFAISPVLAGIGAEHPAITAARANQGCTNSTLSIRQLAMIDHTSDGGFQCLGVFVDGDTVKAVRLERHSFTLSTGHPAVEQVKIVEYPTKTVDSRGGAVIDGIPGHDAIVLRGHFSTPPDTGVLEISYLYNGITGEFRTCQIALSRTSSSGWRLVNRLDQPISLIGVRMRQLPVIGVVGIANLEGACT